jgi:hypothetical protein
MAHQQPTSYQIGLDDKKDGDQQYHLENADARDVALGELHFAHMSAEERAAAMKLALDADPGPGLLSWRYIQFFLSLLVVIFCSCDNGFDGTIMSSVNSMVTFQSYFGLVSASKGTGILFVRRQSAATLSGAAR